VTRSDDGRGREKARRGVHPPTLSVSGRIVEIGPVPEGLARWLAEELTSFWSDTRWTVGRPLDPPREREHGPVDVDRVLDAVIDSAAAGPENGSVRWTLALCGIEVVAPGRGEVFGRATVGGGFALVAVPPLQRGAAPTGEGLALLRTRVLKESLHELGHVADRQHCPNPRCLMHPVRDLAGVDARPFRFCSRCDPFPDARHTA